MSVNPSFTICPLFLCLIENLNTYMIAKEHCGTTTHFSQGCNMYTHAQLHNRLVTTKFSHIHPDKCELWINNSRKQGHCYSNTHRGIGRCRGKQKYKSQGYYRRGALAIHQSKFKILKKNRHARLVWWYLCALISTIRVKAFIFLAQYQKTKNAEYTQNPKQWCCEKSNGNCSALLCPANNRDRVSESMSQNEGKHESGFYSISLQLVFFNYFFKISSMLMGLFWISHRPQHWPFCGSPYLLLKNLPAGLSLTSLLSATYLSICHCSRTPTAPVQTNREQA